MTGDTPKNLPAVLYHYTNTNAFRSIITSQSIRATRYDQMNDDGELRYGFQYLLALVQKKLDVKSEGNAAKVLADLLEYGVEGPHEAYVVSFSAAKDHLEQWRAYAVAGGIAIGFDFAKLQQCFHSLKAIDDQAQQQPVPSRLDPSLTFMSCEYCGLSDEFPEVAPEDLSHIVQELNRLSKLRLEPDRFKWAFVPTFLQIYQAAAKIKHLAYAAEQEWRFLKISPDKTNYPIQLDERNRFYIDLKFDPASYIKEVWISPHGDKQGAMNAATYLKQHLGLSFEIKQSTIPYRT